MYIKRDASDSQGEPIMSGPRLASILTSHTSNEGTELDDFARSLSDDEQQSLLGELGSRASRSDSASLAALLRALLGAAPLRFAAAREAIGLMRSEVLTGKAAVLPYSNQTVLVKHHVLKAGSMKTKAVMKT